MNYLFYYKGEFIAYTDCKKMKKGFIGEFPDLKNLKVEKVKHINPEFKDEEIFDNHLLYYDNYHNMTTNERLTDDMDGEAEKLIDVLIASVDRIYENRNYLKLSEDEWRIIDEFINMYVEILEDCEYHYEDFLNTDKLLEDYVLPSIENK